MGGHIARVMITFLHDDALMAGHAAQCRRHAHARRELPISAAAAATPSLSSPLALDFLKSTLYDRSNRRATAI